MCPGGKVKFGPDGKNIHAHPVRRAVAERRSGQCLPEGGRARAADEDLRPPSKAMLETVAQAVVNGLLIGGIYALVSIGVTLIFGVVKIVNFARANS